MPGDAASDLVPRQTAPFNAETPMRALAEPITPTRRFYVRSHFDVPALEPEAWRLRLGGAVARPEVLSLAHLRELPPARGVVTLECAGNGRTALAPRPSGVPWAYGAVGTAEFAGASLAALLERAGLAPDAREVLFVGADAGEVRPGRREAFRRSLPLEAARHPDTLLAWEMNGEPLTPAHGAPLRLVVPGWYGMASVKWLVGIEVLREPFTGWYQRREYVYAGPGDLPDGEPDLRGAEPVTRIRVRSVFAAPEDGETLPPGPIDLAGSAWSGGGAIRRVEVSWDGGRTWSEAAVRAPRSPHGAATWRLRWSPPRPGAYTLMVRARDTSGAVQPLEPVWNRLGYGNNGVHRIRVTVRGA